MEQVRKTVGFGEPRPGRARGTGSSSPVSRLIARLAALVPRPKTHMLTYHGMLATAAEWRDWIVPAQPRSLHSAPVLTPARSPPELEFAG